jgi:hypothetical protein
MALAAKNIRMNMREEQEDEETCFPEDSCITRIRINEDVDEECVGELEEIMSEFFNPVQAVDGKQEFEFKKPLPPSALNSNVEGLARKYFHPVEQPTNPNMNPFPMSVSIPYDEQVRIANMEHQYPATNAQFKPEEDSKYGQQVTRQWKLNGENETVTVTYKNDVKILISARPLLQVDLTTPSQQHCEFMILTEYQLEMLIKGLWSMKTASEHQSWNYSRIHEFNENYNFIFAFEPLNHNLMGIRIRYTNKENKIVDQGIILSLKAANKLRMWKNFILNHANLLQSQAKYFQTMMKSITNHVLEFPGVKSCHANIRKYDSFEAFRQSIEPEIVNTLNFIKEWNLKSKVMCDMVDCKLNVYSIFTICINNIVAILKYSGVSKEYYTSCVAGLQR